MRDSGDNAAAAAVGNIYNLFVAKGWTTLEGELTIDDPHASTAADELDRARNAPPRQPHARRDLSDYIITARFDMPAYRNLTDVAEQAGIPRHDALTKSERDRLGRTLRDHGWLRKNVRINGQARMSWVNPNLNNLDESLDMVSQLC